MKKLITTLETATSWSPSKVETRKFLQDANNEVFAALIKTIITQNLGSYSLTVPYVIEGCTLSNLNKTITSGKVFYNGIFYNTTALTNTTTAPIKFAIEQTADGTADPTIFSDNSSHNIHLDEHLKTYDNSYTTGVLFDATALVSVYGAGKINICYDKVTSPTAIADQSTTSTLFIDLTNATYTTPNDGKTRKWLVLVKSNINISNSAGDGGELRIYSGSQLETSISYLDPTFTTTPFELLKADLSCQKVISIAPNTVVKAQIRSINGGSVDFINNSFIMVEL